MGCKATGLDDAMDLGSFFQLYGAVFLQEGP